MSDFRKLSDTMFASPQIGLDDVATARDLGIALIVNNRPEGESPDQVPGEEIEAAARDLGIAYLAIPITHAGFSHPQVSALVEAMQSADGPVLGYCRSGTRSTLLWALARASMGEDPAALADAAANAGYDVGAIRPAMDALAAQAG
ncbi:MAG: TIGR01244 family sulfur transferase, partial [Tsuneonella troitsensis]